MLTGSVHNQSNILFSMSMWLALVVMLNILAVNVLTEGFSKSLLGGPVYTPLVQFGQKIYALVRS